jgi:arginyl-tRNA synthetase
MNIQAILVSRFKAALASLGAADAPVPVSKSTRPEFGEYQFNGAMGLAKIKRCPPREVAQQILDAVELDDIADKCEIAGPGFINIHLSADWLAQQANSTLHDPRIGITAQPEQTIVVDYSAPNLAKEMHVGHLRSTIIGDAVAKTLEYMGHNVLRQNHMGDWGTQFGMLLAHLNDRLQANEVAETALSDLEDFYRAAKVRFDNEDGFADRAREYVVKLQGGDAQCLGLWQNFIDVSIAHSEEVYHKLSVTLTRDDVMGESSYNHDLANVVSELHSQGVVVEDAGAQVAFLEELADKNGKPAVYIVQKSGGGYLYATTDLAAIRYRKNQLKASRTLIFTDARQALHFKQTEIVARKAGFLAVDDQYQHCPFGMMLGKDGKPFKTRSGGTVKLIDLLDESVERAGALLATRDHDFSAETLADMAEKIGIGAVKYADLSKNRTTDYIFDWDAMLSFEGNTAPYLQYAFTRIQSIFAKAQVDIRTCDAVIDIQASQEKSLVTKLLQYQDTLEQLINDAAPHVLCTYLYELASLFMKFYEACPILKDEVSAEQKASRLAICALSSETIEHGLGLLGIATLDKM